MNYKNIIEQEIKASLLSNKVEVVISDSSTDENIPNDMLKFTALIGNGEKGGLNFSADLNKFDLKESLAVCVKMLEAQLILYAIECIGIGARVKIQKAICPEITDSLKYLNISEANNHYKNLSEAMNLFNIFENTVFSVDTVMSDEIIKDNKTKKKNNDK